MQENLSSYKARHRHQAQVLTNGRMRLAMPMLSFVLPLQVPLSGTYNSAVIAKDIYEQNHAGRKVYVLDSLSTGPEIALFY